MNLLTLAGFLGDVAQLVERHNGIVEVVGSIPIVSTLRITNMQTLTFEILPKTNPKKYDKNVKAIQDILKKNGVKMSAIEIRELMKTSGLTADEDKIKLFVRQLRRGY